MTDEVVDVSTHGGPAEHLDLRVPTLQGVTTSKEFDQIFVALIAAQAKFETITRDATVDAKSFSYKYAPLDKVVELYRPIFEKLGLGVLQPTIRSTGNQIGVRTTYHQSVYRMVRVKKG